MQFGIVLVHTLVNLPEVQVVGAQAAQRLFELAHGFAFAAPVRADLGHQEYLFAAIGDRLSHERL